MINLICGDCGKSFNGTDNQEGDYWVCPYCHAALGEGEPPRRQPQALTNRDPNAQIVQVLEKLLKDGHGSGNWRRIITLEIDKLKGEKDG